MKRKIAMIMLFAFDVSFLVVAFPFVLALEALNYLTDIKEERNHVWFEGLGTSLKQHVEEILK